MGTEQRIWEGMMVASKMAMSWSSKQISEWIKAQSNKYQKIIYLQRSKVHHTIRLVAPDTGTLKLDVDALVYEEAHSFSIGIVARNHQGLFVRSRTQRFAGQISILEAELVGILEALKWSAEFQEQKISIQSDSLLSVQVINDSIKNLPEE